MQRCSSNGIWRRLFTYTYIQCTQCNAVLTSRSLYSYCSARPIVLTTILLLSSLQSFGRLIVANYRLRSALRLGRPACALCRKSSAKTPKTVQDNQRNNGVYVHTGSLICKFNCMICCITAIGSIFLMQFKQKSRIATAKYFRSTSQASAEETSMQTRFAHGEK